MCQNARRWQSLDRSSSLPGPRRGWNWSRPPRLAGREPREAQLGRKSPPRQKIGGSGGSVHRRGDASPNLCAGRRSRSSAQCCIRCRSRWPCARSSSSSAGEGESTEISAERKTSVGDKRRSTLHQAPGTRSVFPVADSQRAVAALQTVLNSYSLGQGQTTGWGGATRPTHAWLRVMAACSPLLWHPAPGQD